LSVPPPASTGSPGGGPSPDAEPEFPEIIGSAPLLLAALRLAAVIAPSDAAVLIEGESGTGKELVARAIHRRSRRTAAAFITENCAACPEGLLESEFFGVERGAYTGAHRSRAGLFERADGGTLFLDEIGEMDLRLQGKLLRSLQEREVRRVGGSDSIPVDFRLLCATNRTLHEEARAGRFRRDLLYRIEVVTIRLPSLRERVEDIPILARHFLSLHAGRAGLSVPELTASALDVLCRYPWPGNIRELDNEMRRATALKIEALRPDNLSPKLLTSDGLASRWSFLVSGTPRKLEEFEHDVIGGFIRDVLHQTGGNKNRAAEILGIPKTSLYRRLRRYAILPDPGSPPDPPGGAS